MQKEKGIFTSFNITKKIWHHFSVYAAADEISIESLFEELLKKYLDKNCFDDIKKRNKKEDRKPISIRIKEKLRKDLKMLARKIQIEKEITISQSDIVNTFLVDFCERQDEIPLINRF